MASDQPGPGYGSGTPMTNKALIRGYQLTIVVP